MRVFLHGSWLLPLLLAQCETAHFYTQAAAGQAQMLLRRQSVPALLAQPETPAELRRKLKITERLRRFARENLSLPDDAYDSYADLGRKHACWVVFATPEFSLEPKTWWYPIVGSVEYRGYFSESDAKRYGDKLKAEGLDVVVGGVDAYSTLGWFRDPLLNTFIGDSEIDLADLLFHELTHRKVFLPGDTDFNEALATAVAQEGVRRYLRSEGKLADLRHYEQALVEEDAFVREVMRTQESLRRLYASGSSAETMRQRKTAEFAALRRRCARLPELRKKKAYARWLSQPLNNARLNTISTYHGMIPAFQQRLKHHGGDLSAFFAEMKALSDLSPAERRKKLGIAPERE